MRRGIKTRQICFPLFLLVIYFSLISHPACAGSAGCVPCTIIEPTRFLPWLHNSQGHWNPTLKALQLISRWWKKEHAGFPERFFGLSLKVILSLLFIVVHWPKFVTNLHLPARESGKCGLTVPKRKKEMEFGEHIALSLPQTHSKVWTETLI